MTPVKPPATKITRNPTSHSIGRRNSGLPVHSVASQANIWIPVGIATSMLAAEKKACARCGMPTANMWCTQRPKLRKAVAITDSTTHRYPTIGRCANTGIRVLTMPAAGRKMMYTSG
ncbi:hypothetical protein D3C78_1645180 [compost metagenome]